MASARIEFIRLATGSGETRNFVNTIDSIFGTADITVTTTVTDAASRPVAPDFSSYGAGHARITAIGGALIVSFGANPTAPTLGIRIEAGTTEVVPLKTGDKLSFISV